jgi:hypothetical protein
LGRFSLTDPNGKIPRLRSMALAVLGGFLTWQVLSRSLVASFSESPEVALILRSEDPTALINIAERKLNLEHPSKSKQAPAVQSSGGDSSDRISSFARNAKGANGSEASQPEGKQPEAADPVERLHSNAGDAELRHEVRAIARAALSHDPMNARALRILGQVAGAESDDLTASKLMQAAARRSLRESVAVFWLMRESFERKDYAATVKHADVLLRTRPQIIAHVVPTLARIAEDKDGNGALKNALAANPPWREQFFANLQKAITDARTPLDLLLSIKDAPTPPTAAELRDYLAFLVNNNFYELAYYVWLQFLPREQLASVGLLFNGGFELRPSTLPFDWQFTSGSGVTIDLVRRQDEVGGRALFVEFGLGRVDFRGVSQLVVLPPGTYRLTGQYRSRLAGRRGLEWRIICAGAPTPLAKSEMVTGATPVWSDFAVRFTVPSDGCRAQHIRLWLDARSASEQLVTGAAWYDGLQIARVQ